MKFFVTSHSAFISDPQDVPRVGSRERELWRPVLVRRINDIVRVLAVLVLTCALAAPVVADGGGSGGGPGGNNGNGNGNNGNGNNGNGNGNNGNGNGNNGRRPKKEHGSYQTVKVAGYYSGRGRATVAGSNVTIDADLKDPAGNKHKLSATGLQRFDNHFYGTGTLGSDPVHIDGRVDPSDVDEGNGRGRVVKTGRILFNFRTKSGRGGRGAGEKTGAAADDSGKGGGSNSGNGNGNGNGRGNGNGNRNP